MQVAITSRINGDQDLRDTIMVANQACQKCIDIGFEKQTFNKSKLHNLSYKKVRKEFPMLNSSIVTAIRDQASEMLKRLKNEKRPVKKDYSGVRLNHNTFKFYSESKTIGISTMQGRKKYSIIIPKYFLKYNIQKATAATIRMKRSKFFVDIIADVEVPKQRVIKTVIGVDRGIYNPAVTSDNQFFNSKRLRHIKGKYHFLKECLQRAGTRSAKRHLIRLSGRERRFIADTNHCISKKIVNSDCDAIALEELNVAAMKMRKHRRKKQGRRRTQKVRKLIGSWSPTQLLTFIKYKAEMLGKSVIFVNSHFTSQACSMCGDIREDNRKRFAFKCCVCDFCLHSDLNAARNIAHLARGKLSRLHVNKPNVACDDLKASYRDELRASIVTSLVS
jgi:putative transposase